MGPFVGRLGHLDLRSYVMTKVKCTHREAFPALKVNALAVELQTRIVQKLVADGLGLPRFADASAQMCNQVECILLPPASAL